MLSLRAGFLLLTAASATNVGEYIIAGLGVSRDKTSSASTAVSALNRASSHWANATTELTNYTSDRLHTSNGQSSLSKPLSVPSSASETLRSTEHSSQLASLQTRSELGLSNTMTTFHRNASSVADGHGRANNTSDMQGTTRTSDEPQMTHNVSSSTTGPNVTVTSSLSGDCSQQWEQYWLRGPTSVRTSSPLYTSTTMDVDTNYQLDMTSWFNRVEPGTTNLATYTRIGVNGGHTFTTYTTTETYIRTERTDYNYSINSHSTITTKIDTDIFTITPQTYYTSTWYIDYPRPTCALPSNIDPKCQEQWASYVAHGTYSLGFDSASIVKPNCTSAVVTGSQCSTLVGAYFYKYTMYGPENAPGYVSTSGNSKYWYVTPGLLRKDLIASLQRSS